MMQQYVIEGIGSPVHDGLIVQNYKKQDLILLQNTFNPQSRLLKGLKTSNHRLDSHIISYEYEMVKLDGLRWLKQTCIKENTVRSPQTYTELLKVERYFSNIINYFDTDTLHVGFKSIDNKYDHLHIIDTTNLASNITKRQYISNGLYILNEDQYETFIGEAIINLRFRNIFT